MNAISPATVVKGSTMFPRDRVRASLTKYNVPFDEHNQTTNCATCSPRFYAKRTLTHQPIDPADCAEAILFPGEPADALHHRPHLPRGRRTDRGVSAVNAQEGKSPERFSRARRHRPWRGKLSRFAASLARRSTTNIRSPSHSERPRRAIWIASLAACEDSFRNRRRPAESRYRCSRGDRLDCRRRMGCGLCAP